MSSSSSLLRHWTRCYRLPHRAVTPTARHVCDIHIRCFAASRDGNAAVPVRPVPEILFEDLPPLGSDSRPFGERRERSIPLHSKPKIPLSQSPSQPVRRSLKRGGAFQPKRPRERLVPPIADDMVASTDPRSLTRDRLVWLAGRAATLRISDACLWRGIGESIAAVGESELTSAEACRLIQAFAYAPTEAPIDDDQLQRLLKAFAQHVSGYSEELLTRFIYGYAKLAAKRGLSSQKMLDFMSSEILERAGKLRSWRKTRILEAIWHLPDADNEFRIMLAGQVLPHVSNLDSERFGVFVPMLVELKLHTRPGVISKLNTVFKKKLYGFRSPDLLLKAGMPLLLHDLMKYATLVAWLLRLHELRAAPLAALPSEGANVNENERLRTHDSQEERQRDRLEWEDAMGFSSSRDDDTQWSHDARGQGQPLSSAEVQRQRSMDLEMLKVAEFCIRHERPSLFARLPPKALHLLEAVRQSSLEPPDDHQMLELPFVFAEVSRLFRQLGILLHPTIHGPYLLELADPLGRVVVEWDANWTLYPPWRRHRHEAYVQRKHLHLRAEGWRVVCIPNKEFHELEDSDAKLAYLERFVEAQDLAYLRLPRDVL